MHFASVGLPIDFESHCKIEFYKLSHEGVRLRDHRVVKKTRSIPIFLFCSSFLVFLSLCQRSAIDPGE